MEVADLSDEYTEPLANGAELPTHPSSTTALKIVKFGSVRDDSDGTPLKIGLEANELSMLMAGEQGALTHLYLYAIKNNRIFHTRDLVIIDVEVTPA